MAHMLDELVGQRLREVERLSWHAADGLQPELNVGSVHMWFEGNWCAHFDAAPDWTLTSSVSEPGDSRWLGQYGYENGGRWVIRSASLEEPFYPVIGQLLAAAVPVTNEANEVKGITLTFGDRELTLSIWRGQLDTTPLP